MKRRYVYREVAPGKVESFEVTADYVGQRRDGGLRSDAEVYGNLQATDGTPIDSRTKHRRYMAEKGLTTADDFQQSWAKAAEARAEFYRDGGDHRARREAVARAMYQLSTRRDRKR